MVGARDGAGRWVGSGQATVELVAAIRCCCLPGCSHCSCCAGYALTLADGAAEAGALALAAGRPAKSAARGALPGWAEDGGEVSVRGGEVTVRLAPPSPLAGAGRSPGGHQLGLRQAGAGDERGACPRHRRR